MTLKWENYGDIADALEASYPEEDLVNIDRSRLLDLVHKLPEFDDAAEPQDKELIDAVLYAWIGAGSPPDEERAPSWA